MEIVIIMPLIIAILTVAGAGLFTAAEYEKLQLIKEEMKVPMLIKNDRANKEGRLYKVKMRRG